jgi:hypothetical protein
MYNDDNNNNDNISDDDDVIAGMDELRNDPFPLNSRTLDVNMLTEQQIESKLLQQSLENLTLNQIDRHPMTELDLSNFEKLQHLTVRCLKLSILHLNVHIKTIELINSGRIYIFIPLMSEIESLIVNSTNLCSLIIKTQLGDEMLADEYTNFFVNKLFLNCRGVAVECDAQYLRDNPEFAINARHFFMKSPVRIDNIFRYEVLHILDSSGYSRVRFQQLLSFLENTIRTLQGLVFHVANFNQYENMIREVILPTELNLTLKYIGVVNDSTTNNQNVGNFRYVAHINKDLFKGSWSQHREHENMIYYENTDYNGRAISRDLFLNFN